MKTFANAVAMWERSLTGRVIGKTNDHYSMQDLPDLRNRLHSCLYIQHCHFTFFHLQVEMNSVNNGKAGEEGLVEGDLSLQPAQDVKLRIRAEEGTFKAGLI